MNISMFEKYKTITSIIIVALVVIAAIIFAHNNKKDDTVIIDDGAQAQSDQSSTSNTQNPLPTNSTGTNPAAPKPMEYSQAVLHTNMGDITIALDNKNTPVTAENFAKLASSGFYNNTKFHRVIAGFMIQGGDPNSADDSKMDLWGTGGPGYKFADEIKPTNSNVKGTIAMANSGPNTNGSQFFINVADNSFLNTKHTVFGHVTSGYDIVEKISKTKTGANDRPVDPIIITSIDLK